MTIFIRNNRVTLKLFKTHNQHYSHRFISSGNKWTKQKDGHTPGVLTSAINFPSVTTGITVPEFVFQNLGKWENAPLIECGETGRRYTHGEVYNKSRSFAAALIQSGLKRNETVCIFLPNIPEYPIAALGILLAGGIVSPINPNFTSGEIAKQIRDCSGKVVVTTPELVPLVESARQTCPSLTDKTILVGIQPIRDCHSFYEMSKADTFGIDFIEGSKISTDNTTCLLAYSSGTTGAPKGVMHTHHSLVTNLMQMSVPEFNQTEMFGGGRDQDRYVSVLPFFHMFGLHIILFMALHHGTYFYSFSKFDPKSFTKALIEKKPTTLHLVTPLINYLVQDPSVPSNALEHCRGILIGAAPVGKELMIKFEEKFGTGIMLQEVYGMTEMIVTHMTPKEVHNSMTGSCGVVVPGVTCKVVDVHTGEVLGPNQTGEICCQTDSVMKGYLGNETATRYTIRDDKFVYSGDIGYYDEEGFFYVVDRSKDLIKVKGLQVSPSEIENVLRQHPDIQDVAVIGVQHDRTGEAPRAYIVKKHEKLDEIDVQSFLKDRLSSHKQLSGGIQFIDDIPKTLSGKILKRHIADDYYKTRERQERVAVAN